MSRFKIQQKQSGLSMIELMIAMVIGLILTAAVLQVFVASRVTYSMQSGLAKVQENGRFATQFLSRDVRQAGYQGCSTNNSMANTLDDGSGVDDFIDLSNALGGLNNVDGSASYGGKNPVAGTDIILIKLADLNGSCTVESHNPTAASIKCQSPHDYQKGDVLVVSDCSHTAVFQQSNTNNNSTTATVVHNTGQSTPGNCTKGLGLPVLCGDSNGTAYTFPPGASVMRMQSYRYFISLNNFGEPALYRQGISISSAAVLGSNSVELVEGVEDMQILYGVDTGSDNEPDKYVDGTEAAADFEDVSAVRVSLLIQSNEENVVQGTQSLQFNGATRTFTDGRLRKVFTTTVALRNRL